jgi:hypothetical protein
MNSDHVVACLLASSEQMGVLPAGNAWGRVRFPLIVSRKMLESLDGNDDLMGRLMGWKWATYFTTGAVHWLLERWRERILMGAS